MLTFPSRFIPLGKSADELNKVTRYINHSCTPNCRLQRWEIGGYTHIAVVAIKKIQAGTFLSIDYREDQGKKGKAFFQQVRDAGA